MLRNEMRYILMKKLLNVIIFFGLLYGSILQAEDVGDIRELLPNNVSSQRIENDIRKLVSFGTRHTLSETKSNQRGIGAARRWIESEFNKISSECDDCLEIIRVADTISGQNRLPFPTEIVNIIAIQWGEIDPNRMVLMSGDIDSRVSDPMDYTSD